MADHLLETPDFRGVGQWRHQGGARGGLAPPSQGFSPPKSQSKKVKKILKWQIYFECDIMQLQNDPSRSSECILDLLHCVIFWEHLGPYCFALALRASQLSQGLQPPQFEKSGDASV